MEYALKKSLLRQMSKKEVDLFKVGKRKEKASEIGASRQGQV